MRKAAFVLMFSFVLAGCFETNFNFKTVVRRNGKIDREIQINGRGADRFLPPSGSQWKIMTSETKGGQSILDDVHRHVHATGHFIDAGQFTSDFRYDTSKLIANLTDETRRELIQELNISEPLEKEIGTSNRIELEKARKFFTTQYQYREIFEIRRLISILRNDLKKEAIREDTASFAGRVEASSVQNTGVTSDEAHVLTITPTLLSSTKIEQLVEKRLKDEILPKFQFHAEITLPGRIVDSNATGIHGRTALWDFRALDFKDDFSRYVIEVRSRTYNWTVVSVIMGVLALLAGFLFYGRRWAPWKKA